MGRKQGGIITHSLSHTNKHKYCTQTHTVSHTHASARTHMVHTHTLYFGCVCVREDVHAHPVTALAFNGHSNNM